MRPGGTGMNTRRHLLYVVIALHAGFASAPAWSAGVAFYSENSYPTRMENIVSQSRLRLDLADSVSALRPYAGILLDQDTRSAPGLIYNDNSVSPLAGISLRLPAVPVALFTEYRRVLRTIDRADSSPVQSGDLRTGALAYQWLTHGRLFTELYGEGILSTRLDRNLFLQGWSKSGARIQLSRALAADAYLELLGHADRLGLSYNNYWETGPAIRVSARFFENASAALSARRGFGSYWKSGAGYADWTAMLVLAGGI